jgi:phosphonate transport system substrate-binding protein
MKSLQFFWLLAIWTPLGFVSILDLRNEDKLAILSVPVWNQKPLYQSYLIVSADRDASDLSQLKGDVHAYSDPDSNSGYIVTQSELVARDEDRNSFFGKTFFTYGHRNVLRAVASGLAQPGSVDGYVWEAVSANEPDLAAQTKAVWKSEWFSFPPIACQRNQLHTETVQTLQAALITMSDTADIKYHEIHAFGFTHLRVG